MNNLILFIALPIVGIVLGWIIRWLYARFQLSASEQKAERVKLEAIREAEAQRKEILLNAKDELIRERNQQERENRERRAEVQRYEARVNKKEELLDQRAADFEKSEKELADKKTAMVKREEELSKQEELYRAELEKISGLSAQEAKELIIKNLENDARHDAQALINKSEQDAQLKNKKKARDILITTIQRIAPETTSDITVTTVSLPSDEMKGRIIGREGRNIRTLETLTGVDIIIDDTPEAVVISCFDPVRKEIAKESLERLISDGRIHPARIEEIVQKVTHEIQNKIYEEGERALFDLGIHNMNTDGVRALGRLYFRTSYGQNALKHSIEVAQLAGLLAAEIGEDVRMAKRAGLLHDIGKAVDHEMEGSHIQLGAELCKKYKESPLVINAVESHHGDVEPESLIACLVQAADTISAARPGARRETLETYSNRLQQLEDITNGYKGVEKSFAIQAGREIRIMVVPDQVSDADMVIMARDISKQIESELEYPGQIKVNVIRESRIVDYAK